MVVPTDPLLELSFPKEEERRLRRSYASARVILEYGSGGSTLLAAQQPDKLVFSVESDRDWSVKLQQEIDRRDLPSPALLYHVDIGPTGAWGRPLGPENWTTFHRYPLSIWEEPFFREPDVVLIDGRFRPACLMTVILRASKPVTVLFDDYTERPAYHSVEAFVKPTAIVGRMAVFNIEPQQFDPAQTGEIMEHFFRATYATKAPRTYASVPSPKHQRATATTDKDIGHD